ncbi:MAG: HAD family hydrolase [Ilumatobacteraceae bacterium]
MKVAGHPISAGVFDMDGALVDSEPLHHQALNSVLSHNDRAPLSFEAFRPYLGASDDFIWDELVHRQRLPRPATFYQDQFDGYLIELSTLRDCAMPLAVASSSRRWWIETCLDAIGVRSYFDVIVDGQMVACEPDPAIYLLAAQLLDVAPEECFAVEDSPRGARAAVSAGMLTIAVDAPYTGHNAAAAAHIHVRSLDELFERVTDSWTNA